jgi:hypothetical protein
MMTAVTASHLLLNNHQFHKRDSGNNAEGRGFETRWGDDIFSVYLILPAALSPGVYSVSHRNGYQKKKFMGSRARPVGEADNSV